MHKIFKCWGCDRYTIKEKCPICGKKTKSTRPPKFSLEDKFGKYRRILKHELETKSN